jgi:hypothetical protein
MHLSPLSILNRREVQMVTPEEVASNISSLIESSRDHKITGVELSVLIRHKFPDFSPDRYPECRNLRGFIRRFAPTITEVGRSGADVVYGVRRSMDAPRSSYTEVSDTATPSLAPPAAIASRLDVYISSTVWKTFVTPLSRFKLYANTETGAFEVIPPGGGSLQSPWVQIPPCPAEVHRQIAMDFIASLPDEPSRKALESTLAQPGLWWDNYYSIIQQLGLDWRWKQHRRRRIVHQLESSLKEHSVPLAGMLAASSTRRPTPQQPLALSTPIEDVSEDSKLRSLAIDVVRNMKISELRELKVSLGYVIDALAAKRN